MLITIIILSIILVVSAAIIFCLWQVLKDTFFVMENNLDELNTIKQTAYNNVYLPATVVTQILFEQPHEQKLVDFSTYEKYKIVYFAYYTTEKQTEYITDEQIDAKYLAKDKNYKKEDLELLRNATRKRLFLPQIYKNQLVYETSEGKWCFKC